MANNKETKGLAVAGMVCGIVGAVFAWIPGVNVIGIILGALAAIFGGVCIAKKHSSGQAIAGLVLGIVSVGVAVIMNIATVKVTEGVVDAGVEITKTAADISSEINKMTGESTDEILGKDVEVTLGNFTVENNGYYNTSKLPVTVKNLLDESKSFNIQIEAVDTAGNRIDTGYVYASSLSAGQSQQFDVFTYVSSDKIEAFKTAKFNIVQVQEL